MAASISTVEVVGLGLVYQIQNLIAYAAGYGIGVIVGMKIEDKLALGYIMVNVITGLTQNTSRARLRSDELSCTWTGR
jgi:uncharacterized protein YebE (UPF0316 family)